MIEELKIGEQLGETKPEIRILFGKILNDLGIKLKQLKPDWEYILHDKKIMSNEINLPVVKRPGKAKLIKIKLDKLISFFQAIGALY